MSDSRKNTTDKKTSTKYGSKRAAKQSFRCPLRFIRTTTVAGLWQGRRQTTTLLMRRIYLSVLITVALALSAHAQQFGQTLVNGQYFPYVIDDCGDTLIVASLEDVSVTSPRRFADDEEYRRYRRYRYYAVKVYPYAVEAIRIFRETEYVTANMRDGRRNRYIRRLQTELKNEFADPLRNLSKTQGLILIKMIERELDTPLYYLIKDLRGGITATYWNAMGKLFDHQIKEGYQRGEDPILDAVLDDFKVSYQKPAPPPLND